MAALTPEPATARVQRWLGDQPPESLLVSDWVITEFSSALALKLRTGALELEHRAAALAAFHDLLGRSLTVAAANGLHFRMAAAYVDRHELGLRAGDALHLAIAADAGAAIATLDQRQRDAALALGVPIEAI